MTSLVESFFGLRKPAFTVSQTRGPVLMTTPLRKVANFLRGGLDSGAPILCVTGCSGIGKSSVARALSKLTGDRWHIARMSGRAKCWDDLHEVLTREFGIDQSRITKDGLEAARAKFGRLLIVVDDAQHLSPALLERICILPQLHTEVGEPVTQVVLFADLDSVALNEIRPLRDWFDIDSQIVMEPMPASDVHRYVDKRLRQVGWAGQSLFSESGALALHRFSLGHPRKLSMACLKVLDLAANRGLRLVDGAFVIECLDVEGTPRPLPVQANSRSWKADRQSLDLTAESINAAPSLELQNPDQIAKAMNCGGPPIESMRSVARTVASAHSGRPPRAPRRTGPRPIVVALCAFAAGVALHASRVDVADVLLKVGVHLPFVSEGVDAQDASIDANPEASSDRDTASLTLPHVAAPKGALDPKARDGIDLAGF